MVGTMLLGLYDTSDAKYQGKATSMVIYEGHRKDQDGVALAWRAPLGSWCAFYPDRAHEVLPLTKGQRITIAFKVYSITASDVAGALSSSSPSIPITVVNDTKGESKDGGKKRRVNGKTKSSKESKESSLNRKKIIDYKRQERAQLIAQRLVTLTYELSSEAPTLHQIRQSYITNTSEPKKEGAKGFETKGGQSEKDEVDDGSNDGKANKGNNQPLQLGLILKNFYSLFPGELKGGRQHLRSEL
jgi:hypothetical protein